jgi:hypothetical protein
LSVLLVLSILGSGFTHGSAVYVVSSAAIIVAAIIVVVLMVG